MKNRKFIGLAISCLAFAAAISIVGCASGGGNAPSGEGSGDASAATSAPAAAAPEGPVLTVATGDPAWPPYVLNDSPESGEGFEAALTYAVAEKMGYSHDQVVWVRTGFDEAITPGEKDWDMNIQQFGVTEERKQAVDFSTPYFMPTQSVVVDAAEGHDKYAKATTLAELDGAVLGVEAGSTSYTWGKTLEQYGVEISILDSNAVAAEALNVHQIDGIILDTPTAVYMADPEMEELDAAALIGQIPGSEADPLAFLLPKDSELTAAVSAAIDELAADGTLQELTDKWMAEYTIDVPVLG